MKITRENLPDKRRGKEGTAPRSARLFPWTKAEDALLGRRTDREVAEKLNRTLGGVRDRRKFLGKPAVDRGPAPLRMEREPRDHHARLFAAKSNRELHAILGWSYKRIRTRRHQLAGGKVRKSKPEWTLEEDRLLGTMPDQVLARKFGRAVKAVRSRRWKKRLRLRTDWRPEDDRILGTRTDRQVAMLLGRSTNNVAWRRSRLGIAPKAKPRPWTPGEEALLGSKPDEQLARRFGRTVQAVAARRIMLGRPKADAVFKVLKANVPGDHHAQPANTVNVKSGARYCTWSVEEDALLGKLSDEEVAGRLGYSVTRVRRRRHLLGVPCGNPTNRPWTKAEMALLGTRPDREVAPLVNRSLANVRYKRLELGIPFCNPRYEIWKPAELALLGKVSDEEIAHRTGHSLTSVRQARHKRHILGVRPSGLAAGGKGATRD